MSSLLITNLVYRKGIKMKIIIAPAKIMKIDRDSFPVQSKPEFLTKTRILEHFLKSRTKEQLDTLWHASQKVTEQSILQLKNMDYCRIGFFYNYVLVL